MKTALFQLVKVNEMAYLYKTDIDFVFKSSCCNAPSGPNEPRCVSCGETIYKATLTSQAAEGPNHYVGQPQRKDHIVVPQVWPNWMYW